MMTERIKAILEERPFRPFVIHTSDGKSVTVKSPDFAWLHPAGFTMYVCPNPDVDADQVVNLSHVTRLAAGTQSGDKKRRR